MISHKCYSNSYVTKGSKDSSRGFQASSEISFLISTKKPSRHLIKQSMWLLNQKFSLTKHPINLMPACLNALALDLSSRHECDTSCQDLRQPNPWESFPFDFFNFLCDLLYFLGHQKFSPMHVSISITSCIRYLFSFVLALLKQIWPITENTKLQKTILQPTAISYIIVRAGTTIGL